MAHDSNGVVVCPKPRRFVNFDELIFSRSSRFLHYRIQQMEANESKAGKELLDIILKGNCGTEKSSSIPVASSPPFYSGSPPVRASNPLIQDEHFRNCKPSPLSPSFELQRICSPSSYKNANGGGGGGGVLAKYVHDHPLVRVEGFNCRVYGVA